MQKKLKRLTMMMVLMEVPKKSWSNRKRGAARNNSRDISKRLYLSMMTGILKRNRMRVATSRCRIEEAKLIKFNISRLQLNHTGCVLPQLCLVLKALLKEVVILQTMMDG